MGRGLKETAPGEGPGGRELITSQDSALRWVFWREEGLELLLKVELGGNGVGLGLGLRFGWGWSWGWLDVRSMSGIRGAPEAPAEVGCEGAHLGSW